MKYRKSLLPFICLLFISSNIVSQNIQNVYLGMPDDLSPTLSSQQRHELMEYFKVNQSDKIENRFGTESQILVLDTINQHIVVQSTSISTQDILLFYTADSLALVGVINTVCAPICHSNIQFYDTIWKKVSVMFNLPQSIDWLNPDSVSASFIDKDWIGKVLENNFIKLKFDSAAKTIVAENQILEFLSDENKKELEPLLSVEPFIYRFSNKMWIR